METEILQNQVFISSPLLSDSGENCQSLALILLFYPNIFQQWPIILSFSGAKTQTNQIGLPCSLNKVTDLQHP